MKKQLLLIIFIFCSFSLFSKNELIDLDKYKYPFEVTPLSESDTDNEILKKAANILANKRSLDYHKLEFTGFIHFGINTFTGVEWGNGKESANVFNPPSVDTDQWCRIMKKAGMKLVMLTVKHHDGYCLWQTRYNSKFSIKQSNWKKGKGDVLRKLVASAKKYDLKLGVYLSPADLYQIESKKGLYGNKSSYQDSIIPTDPMSFTNNPMIARKVSDDLPKFKIKVDDYNRYFMNQLYELLTEYGPIHEVWFDGAHPKRKGGQTYVKTKWFSMIRKLAPNAAIFGGPDVRWVGNEHGGTRKNEWNIIPIPSIDKSGVDKAPYTKTFGEDKDLIARKHVVYRKTYFNKYLRYIISEVDVSIRRGWFWRNDYEQRLHSAEKVFDMYERSVGGNAVFLLNVPPNNQGKFSKRDVDVLSKVGQYVKDTYKNDLFSKATVSAPSLKKDILRDNDIETFYLVKDFNKQIIEVKLPNKKMINRFQLQEAISKVGQRIAKHKIEAFVDGKWKTVSVEGVVGYKRIHRFQKVFTDRFRVIILKSRANLPVGVSEISAYFFKKPVIINVKQQKNGKIFLNPNKNFYSYKDAKILYTLDGTTPNKNSIIYNKKGIENKKGGVLKYRVSLEGKLGKVEKKLLAISAESWNVKVSSCRGRKKGAIKLIDFNKRTYWETAKSEKIPHDITIDFAKKQNIAGFSYTPFIERKRGGQGLINNWQIWVSDNGENWKKIIDGTYGNIVNDPSERTYFFKKKLKTRYLKFVATGTAKGSNFIKVAEMNFFPIKPDKE